MKKIITIFIYILLYTTNVDNLVFAENTKLTDDNITQNKETSRKFDDVLNDLINEFAYDIKTNQITNISTNISIRIIGVNDSIPKSYETYLENLITEKIRLHSKIKIIHCMSCKMKKSILEDGKLKITTVVNNPVELDNLAKKLAIDNWLDAYLFYQETSMILSFKIFDANNKELIWTKLYNSESIYRKKLAQNSISNENQDTTNPDNKQLPSKTFAGIFTLGYYLIPNIKTSASMMGATFKAADKFNYGYSEMGIKLGVYADPSLFISNYSGINGDPSASVEVTRAEGTKLIKPFTYGLGIFPYYQQNFYGLPETYESIRFATNLSLGAIFSSGYLSFTAGLGLQIKFGRWFVTELAGIYSAPTSITIKDVFSYKTRGGVGAEATFGIFF